MNEYMITLQSDHAPELLLGQKLLGGKVIALNISKRSLVTVNDLMKKYGYSRPTIIEKLEKINQGTPGKHLYDPDQADELLNNPEKKRGRPRQQ